MSYLPADRERLYFSTLTIFNTFLTQGWVSSPFYPIGCDGKGQPGGLQSLFTQTLATCSLSP